mgnify:CR=1 FL=1
MNDFEKLSSKLGFTFDITGYNIENIGTHLFGGEEAKIEEC